MNLLCYHASQIEHLSLFPVHTNLLISKNIIKYYLVYLFKLTMDDYEPRCHLKVFDLSNWLARTC